MYIRDKNGNYVPVPTIAGGDGREVELRATKDYIQWRYKDLDWQNLVAVADLIGPKGDSGDDGQEIELRTYEGEIQWRLGDGGWQTLFTMDVYATIKIGDVVTGAPGTDVSVTNSGTSTEAVLNFTIPRGEPGMVAETHASQHAADGEDPISPNSIGAATTEDVANAISEAISNLKQLINTKFGCDIESSTGNINIQGTLSATAVVGAVWNEDE